MIHDAQSIISQIYIAWRSVYTENVNDLNINSEILIVLIYLIHFAFGLTLTEVFIKYDF